MAFRPMMRGVLGASSTDLRAQAISTLFGSGEQGVLIDPSDLSTMWQDSAGTVAVTQDGDPVGRIDDLSGNGNHFTQSTTSIKPLYKTDGALHWLRFDGFDDHFINPATHDSVMSTLLVYQHDSDRFIYGGQANNSERRFFDRGGGNLRFWYGDSGGNIVRPIGTSTAYEVLVSEDASTATVFVDRTQELVHTKTGAVSASQNSALGDVLDGASVFGDPVGMEFYGLIEVHRAVSDSEIDLMRQLSDERWKA